MSTIETSVEAVGCIVYWNCLATDRESLSDGLDGLDMGHLLPNKRTPESALFHALKAFTPSGKRSDFIVEPLKSRGDNGYEVVEVKRGVSSNDYTPAFSASIDKASGVVRVIEGSWEYSDINGVNLQILYDKFRNTLSGSSVGACLVDVCQYLKGTSLRPSGGIYWLPEDVIDKWDEVSSVVFDASVSPDGDSSVYRLRTVLDENAASAVIDAITAEVTTQSDEILDGIGELGERALRTREDRSRELKKKVEHYEQMLGESLDKLKSVCDIATKSAAHAVLAQL